MLKVSQRQAYGLTDPHEMMAELSDEAFRKDLSAVPFWVYQDEKGGVVNISDYNRYRVRRGSGDTIKQMNGVETLELLLEKMAENYDPAEEKSISDMLRARAVFRKGDGRRNTQDVSDAARKTLERMSGEFGVKAHVHETLDDKIAPNIQSELRKGGKAWYEPKDGTVHVFLPNAEGALDAAQSYVHEVVAHKGMEGMLGRERYRQLCERLGNALNRERSELVKKYEGSDTRTLGDEYIAAIAEKAIDTDGAVREPSLWDKIKATVRSFFREAFNLDLTDADIKYMLWKSAERLRRESRGVFRTAEDVVTEQKLNGDSLRMRRAEADYLREMDEIAERAEADGTYMKAPNGKPSNLDARQWAQVRTDRFKSWFGDWEKPLRIDKLRKSEPVFIRGDEIEPGDELKRYKANAREYGKALRGSYTNKDTGRSFTLGKQGVLEVLNHDSLNAVQLQSVAAIPQIIENSIYIDSLPNEDVSKNPDVRQYHYFVCGLKVGSADYTVRAVIAERANGEWYYDHKLTQIEKGKLLDSLSGITTPGFSQEASKDSAGKDMRLSSILQANCSKIVDENGEPKVVYHGTDADFTVFDTPTNMSRIFTSSSLGFAKGYGRAMELFANVRNPLTVDFEGRDAFEPVNVNGRQLDDIEELASYAGENGYDGVIARNVSDIGTHTSARVQNDEYIVIEPNQLKSATSNIGTFDGADSDIRFRTEEKASKPERRPSDWKMAEGVKQLAKELNLDNVDILTDTDSLEEKKAKSKGFYTKSTGRITVVIPNHADIADAQKTLLHEAVAHYGLRKLFGANFDTFLDNVYENAEEGIRKTIETNAEKKHKGDIHAATEEYLASLAEETDFKKLKPSFWKMIKNFFLNMLHRIGFKDFGGITLSDNELRYILWRSYKNLEEPGSQSSIFGMAEDISKRYELEVGDYSPTRHSLADTNRLFNRKLEDFNEENADRITFDLGYPSNKLVAAGVENKPIKLYGSKLLKKIRKHGFAKDEIRDLPKALSNPIAVFDNFQKEGNRSVLIELKTADGNFLVAIDLGKGPDIDFDIVSSVFGKSDNKVVNWLIKGYAKYIDKKKALGYLHLPAPIAGASDNRELLDAAKIVENFENPKFEEENSSENTLFRDGDPEMRERSLARDAYESRVRNGMYQAREAVQDSMLSLKEAMKAVLSKQWKGIDEVEGFENPYQGENRLSSQNLAEVKAFERTLFKPLLDMVSKLSRNEDERRELTDYMMAKHGLERNRVMAERNAKKDEDVAEIDRLRQSLEKRHDSGKLDDDDYADAMAKADSEYEKAYEAALAAAERDYAGLTALTGLEELAEAEAEATRMVEDYEDGHDTAELWGRVNAVTKATLSKVYESGMLTKDAYQDINSMYEYYIPLRGFDEKTSAEAYAYLTHKNSAFNAPIKKAEGRTSKSDDPLAYMRSMATSAIVQGNRNVLVKQRLLNFALNHPSDLFSVSELWIAYDATKDEWTPVFPDNIGEDDTPAEVESKMADFEKTMQELASSNPDLYKKGRDAVGIPYRVVEKRELQQHQVIVKRGGRDVVVTVNGSPRVAQAVNGLTNPDNDIEGSIGTMLRAGEWVNRQLSALYTTRNPDFVISNFMRDALYSNSMAWIKESPNYALRFHRNFAVLNPLVMKKLFAKLREGKLDMSNEREAAFSAFIMNGGETGYTNMKDLDKIKREINGLYKLPNILLIIFQQNANYFFDL